MSPLVFHQERCPDNAKLKAFIAWWAQHGPFPLTIAYGNRSDAEQWELYQLGRTKPGKIVTNAKSAAESAHGHSAAIDCYPVREVYGNGMPKLVYMGDEADLVVRSEAKRRFEIYARLGKDHGLESGLDFPGLHDAPHLQDPDWKSRPLNT